MQQRTKIFVAGAALLAIVSLITVGVSQASEGWGHRWGGKWRHGGMGGHHQMAASADQFFDRFDANGDGTLSKAEIDDGIKSRLTASDANKDGGISVGEFEKIWLEFSRPFMVRGFQMLDGDADGRISEAEISNPLHRIVSHLDQDDDGAVSKKEMHNRHGRKHDRSDKD